MQAEPHGMTGGYVGLSGRERVCSLSSIISIFPVAEFISLKGGSAVYNLLRRGFSGRLCPQMFFSAIGVQGCLD